MDLYRINATSLFSALDGGSPLSLVADLIRPQYVIRDSRTGDVAIEYSGMSLVQPMGKATITTAPVEQGFYQSINKVREPMHVRCEIIIQGLTGFTGTVPNLFDGQYTSQSDTLQVIKDMLGKAGLYDIETPKEMFLGYDLIDYEYTVSSQQGVSMLVVGLTFQEVIQQMEVVLAGAQSSDQPTTDDTSSAATGAGSSTKQANTSPDSVDSLTSVKDNITGNVRDGTQGGLNGSLTGVPSYRPANTTVGKPASTVLSSPDSKANSLSRDVVGGTL